MTVDEHIAEAKRLVQDSSDNGVSPEISVAWSSQAAAHAAIASALLARYPGWQYTKTTPGDYDGTD